jgi:hypothetical protein
MTAEPKTYRDLLLDRVIDTIHDAIGGHWWDVDPSLAHVLEDIFADLKKTLNEDAILAKALDQPVRNSRERRG